MDGVCQRTYIYICMNNTTDISILFILFHQPFLLMQSLMSYMTLNIGHLQFYAQFQILIKHSINKNNDICGLPEYWLYEKDLIYLDQIISNYKSHADSDLQFCSFQGAGELVKVKWVFCGTKDMTTKLPPEHLESIILLVSRSK